MDGATGGHTVRLEICSAIEMLESVDLMAEQVGRMAGLDEDARHWVGMSVRESVINAIKHGNKHDRAKHVFVEMTLAPVGRPTELVVRVRDQGTGFDPEGVPDPLAPENMLKTSGRGLFLIHTFMDDVSLTRAAGGGTEIRMVKRLCP
jgi:serine/threonine-protein kinase RsbW